MRQETIWLENIPVAVIKKATATSPILVYFIHADHLNTPRVIVNQSNTPVWRWENTHAFGANLPDENPDGNTQLFEYHPRFPGQYFDKETGLHYNYFRYYEPETGRYISPDPIGLAGGLNTYGYAASNPVSFTDPTGENPVLLWALSGALTLWDMLKPMQPNSQYPDAIESVWTVPGPVGSAKNLCRFTNDVPRDPIILGENMKRVQAYANKIGGKTINDFIHSKNWSIENNEVWLKKMKSEGRMFIDIGPDFARRAQRIEQGIHPNAPAYNLERFGVKGYSSYESIFERTGKFSGGVKGFDY